MRQHRTHLKRLQRELQRRQRAQAGRPAVVVVDEDAGELVPPGAKVLAVVNVDLARL